MPQSREPYTAPAEPEVVSSVEAAEVEFAGSDHDDLIKGSFR